MTAPQADDSRASAGTRLQREECKIVVPRFSYGLSGLILLGVYAVQPAMREGVYAAVALAAAVAVAYGVVAYRAPQPGWRAVALALALFAGGHLLNAFSPSSAALELQPSAANALYFAGEVTLLAGIMSIAGAGSRRAFRPALLDALLVATAAAYCFWVALIEPLLGQSADPAGAAIAVVVPMADIVLAWALARYLFEPAQRTTATTLLMVGALGWLLADVVFARLLVAGEPVLGGPVELGWLLGFLLFGAAGLQPSMAVVTAATENDERALGDHRLLLVWIAILVPSIMFAVDGLPKDGLDYAAFVFACTGSALVGGARLLGATRASRALFERERALQGQLDHRARTDQLTGLLNRAEITERLAYALPGSAPVGLLFLDLDDFKRINDAFGHQSGDDLLREVADRIRASVRTHDQVARLGGDEFAILLGECRSEADAIVVAERILQSFGTEIRLEEHVTRIRASIGIVRVAPGELTAGEALSRADIAMYAAKARGAGSWQIFAPAMHAEALARAQVRSDLDRAVLCDEIVPWYQPIFDVEGGRLVGVEALARWQHPERGLLQPADFIEVAEASGRIGDIDRSMILAATRDVARWTRETGLAPQLHVNVSPRELTDPATVLTVAAAIEASGLDPRQLVVEVTETALIDELAVKGTLDGLVELGVRLAIDDFGSRYAVLAQLGRMPVDILKLDPSLVAGLDSPKGRRLLRGIVRLADSLGLKTVAEGVESTAILPTLRAIGCTAVQGYALSRPIPAAEMEASLMCSATAPAATA